MGGEADFWPRVATREGVGEILGQGEDLGVLDRREAGADAQRDGRAVREFARHLHARAPRAAGAPEADRALDGRDLDVLAKHLLVGGGGETKLERAKIVVVDALDDNRLGGRCHGRRLLRRLGAASFGLSGDDEVGADLKLGILLQAVGFDDRAGGDSIPNRDGRQVFALFHGVDVM